MQSNNGRWEHKSAGPRDKSGVSIAAEGDNHSIGRAAGRPIVALEWTRHCNARREVMNTAGRGACLCRSSTSRRQQTSDSIKQFIIDFSAARQPS
jgi:hypothetical protein